MKPNTNKRILTTTESSLEIIDTIVQQNGVTASALATELDLAQSTIHKHLNTLAKHGYIVRENNRYYAGAKFCHIADYVRRRKPEYLIAGKIVDQLAQETELEADFAVEEHGHIISIQNELNFSDETHFLADGRYFHVHSTASGKAILAEYPEERVNQLIDTIGLSKSTEKTIVDKDELLAELETVRERGYATSIEEEIEGLWAIAKAVKTPIGEVCGSLNLSAPTYLYSEEMQRSAAEILKTKVSEFEEQIEQEYRTEFQ